MNILLGTIATPIVIFGSIGVTIILCYLTYKEGKHDYYYNEHLSSYICKKCGKVLVASIHTRCKE